MGVRQVHYSTRQRPKWLFSATFTVQSDKAIIASGLYICSVRTAGGPKLDSASLYEEVIQQPSSKPTPSVQARSSEPETVASGRRPMTKPSAAQATKPITKPSEAEVAQGKAHRQRKVQGLLRSAQDGDVASLGDFLVKVCVSPLASRLIPLSFVSAVLKP